MLICALKVRVDHTATEKEGFLLNTWVIILLSSLCNAVVINNHKTQNYEASDEYLIGFDMPVCVQRVHGLLPEEVGVKRAVIKYFPEGF